MPPKTSAAGRGENADLNREEVIARGGAVFRAYQTSNDNFDQAIADHAGMNRTDMRCLDLIDQAGGMTAGELAKAAGLTSGAVTAVVDRLEKAGMARRVADPADRRRVRIEITPKLWEATGPLMTPFLEESQAILDDYTTEELARFSDFLERVIAVQAKHTERIRRSPGPAPGGPPKLQ
ncbi:MAG TPA: MarR family transcriptional regulator [Solirubrobacteraceae bacterium]|nr:MarR family transcriptional regulator [Solirubrobacteraceae bacterium]